MSSIRPTISTSRSKNPFSSADEPLFSLSLWERAGVRGEARRGGLSFLFSQTLTLTLSQREGENYKNEWRSIRRVSLGQVVAQPVAAADRSCIHTLHWH